MRKNYLIKLNGIKIRFLHNYQGFKIILKYQKNLRYEINKLINSIKHKVF